MNIMKSGCALLYGHNQELDWESIAAGLLHDTVEDTDMVTFETIQNEFGATVSRIVEGETKVYFSSHLFTFSIVLLTVELI